MLRAARIDALGALHHVICPKLAHRKIFRTDTDRNDHIAHAKRSVIDFGPLL
jgi:hypothetical protein